MVNPHTLPLRLAHQVVVVTALLLSTQTPTAQEPTKGAGLIRLKSGNERFVKNASAAVSLGAPTREALAKGQHPFAMVLSCADSRVPPEYIFNVGLGDLFVIRAAGEVIDRSVMASLEYGAEHLDIPLLIVMGHESCGAVQAAVESTAVEGPNLQYLVKAIRAGTDRSPSERKELRGAILANVEQVINDAMAGSQILRRAVAAGTLQMVGAYYELSTGRVMFSDPVSVPATIAQNVGTMRALTLAFGVLVLGSPFVAAQSHTPEVPAHAAEAKSPAPQGPLTTPTSRLTSAQTPAAEKAAVVKPTSPVPADIEAKLQALRERVAAARAAAPRTRAKAAAARRPVPRPRVVVRWPEDRVTLTWSHPDERVLVSWAR